MPLVDAPPCRPSSPESGPAHRDAGCCSSVTAFAGQPLDPTLASMKRRRKKFRRAGPSPGGHVSPAPIWTSAGVARTLEKRQIAWINAELHTRDLKRQADELFDPNAGPCPQSPRYNMLMGDYVRQKYQAGLCEERVRDTECEMRTGAWSPIDINEQIRKPCGDGLRVT